MDVERILVVIPAYNEEKTIFSIVKSIYNLNISNLDIIVINDCSVDNTSYEAKKANAIVIDLPNNLGIGGAVQTGYLYAYENDYDIAIQVDGDGQHDVDYIQDLINELTLNNIDIAIGSRFIKDNGYNQSFFRQIGISFFSFLIKLLTNKKVFDVTSGFRAINKKVINLFKNYYPVDYPEVETIVYALEHNYQIKEIPVKMNQRLAGKSSITPVKSIYYMLKVTLSILLPKK